MLFVILLPEIHLPGIYLISARELTLKKKKMDLKLGKVLTEAFFRAAIFKNKD